MTDKSIHNLTTTDLTRELYLFAYDCPAESAAKTDDRLYRFLGAKRREIWSTTKKVYRCIRLQESLYRVDPSVVEKLDEDITLWKKQYKDEGFEVALEVFPLATNEAGYGTFVAMQTNSTLDYIEHTIKLLKEYDAAHELTSKSLKEQKANLDAAKTIIASWYAPGKPDHDPDVYKLLKNKYDYADELMYRVEKTATIIDPYKRMKSSVAVGAGEADEA